MSLFSGRGNACVLKDDFQWLVDKMYDADGIVWAVPIFEKCASGLFHTVMDRFGPRLDRGNVMIDVYKRQVLLYGLGNFLYRLALTGKAGVVLYYAYLLLLLLPIGMISYLFPVLSRFTFGAGGLIGTCWKLALNHLPSTLLLGLLTAAAAWACLSFWIPVLVLPAVAALLASLPLERIFRPYLELPGGGETEE